MSSPVSPDHSSETFVNVSIVDSKHVPEAEELFTELATSEGCVLFECASLLKAIGIDLVDCPLQISLKLLVRKRLQQGTSLLYHMVLPLAVISKHLLQPPHEWDTWVGLLPSNASLEVCAPGDMFGHALVNLLADKVSPKLRLKFRYHNPEFHAHMAQQKQSKEERQQQMKSMAASYGQQRFQDLHKFTSFLRTAEPTEGGDSSLESAPASLERADQVQQGASSEASQEVAKESPTNASESEQTRQDEQHILGSLRRAMLGVLVDTITGAEPQELQAVRRRFPKIAAICEEISKESNAKSHLEEENSQVRLELRRAQERLKEAEEEIAKLKSSFHGQSPEIDLL